MFGKTDQKMSDKFKIGYVPYTSDMSHPGDRRRLGAWANATHSKIIIDSPFESDLLVLSAAANFKYWLDKSRQPVILDLVDGYLGESPNILKDAGRNLIRSFKGKSNYSSITFTRALRDACRRADAIIVASKEQAKDVFPYNSNVYVILDDHSELDRFDYSLDVKYPNNNSRRYIFWEGFGYTLKHFELLSHQLDSFMHVTGYGLLILTNPKFARWGGYLGEVDAENLVKRWFPKSKDQIQIIPWSIDEVIRCASISDFAIIPVDTSDRFANLKPENKLLSMWHLGLPTLFSSTKAYKRVATEVGISQLCIEPSDWQECFFNFELNSLQNTLSKSLKYIQETHTQEILAGKWQKVFETVLAESA